MPDFGTYILTVPAQPKFGVPEQVSFSCRPCGDRFVKASSGFGQLVATSTIADCAQRYDGCRDRTAETT